MMEFAFPALDAFKGIGCLTKTKKKENIIDSTATPFRTASLLTDTVAKTCTELTVREPHSACEPPATLAITSSVSSLSFTAGAV